MSRQYWVAPVAPLHIVDGSAFNTFTTFQANRLSQENLQQGLGETQQGWETFQDDRYKKLKLGVRTLGNDPGVKAAVASDQATVFDLLQARKIREQVQNIE